MKELIAQYQPSDFLTPEEYEQLKSTIASTEEEPMDDEVK